MVEDIMPPREPTIGEVTALLKQTIEEGRRTPWFPDYDKENLISFSRLVEIGLSTYGEYWKNHLTTQTKDFGLDPRPIEDKNIAVGCLTVLTLDGTVGTLTHILDDVDPQKTLQYLYTLHEHKKGIPVIISGGRDGISETLLTTIREGLLGAGYIIRGEETMGSRVGRIAVLDGANRRAIIKERDRRTGKIEEIPLSF